MVQENIVMNQPDFSDFIVHFTKNAPPHSTELHPVEVDALAHTTARERLDRILRDGRILATRMPYTNRRAACFTECTWPSLLLHCQHYSPFGVGFRKSFVFQRGGGPAIYIRQDHYQSQVDKGGFADDVYPFLTPFAPGYAPPAYLQAWNRPPIDFTYQREWRTPNDLQFTPQDVEFVLVDVLSDFGALSAAARAGLPESKWILLSNYKNIETLWPQHNIGGPV